MLQKLQNLEQEITIALAVNNSAYKSHYAVQESFKRFENITETDKSLIQEYKKQPNLFVPDSLKVNFSYTSGLEFPEQLLIEIDVFGLASTALFDVSNYQKGVQDISLKVKDLVKEKMFGKQKLRSNVIYLQSNPMDKKSHLTRQGEMFLIEVLRIYREKLSIFTKLKSFKAEQLKTNEKELKNLKQNISSQIDSVLNYSTKIFLDKELDLMFGATENYNKNNSLTDSWNFILIDIFSEIQLFVSDLQETYCVNFLDCLEFYTDILKSITRFEKGIASLNMTEKIQTWKNNLLQLTTSYRDINQSGNLITATVDSLLETNLSEWFCGHSPSVTEPLTGTINIREGESVALKVKVLDAKYDFKIIWKHNNYILKGYNTTVFNKKLTKKDEGYYSCKITNKFGVGGCGKVFIKIHENIQFLKEPQDTVGYLYSPRKIYLTCAVKCNTSNGKFSWFFRQFDATPSERYPLPESTPDIEINQDTVRSTGFYICQFENELFNALSREAVVHVLKTTVAVQRIEINMVLSRHSSSKTWHQVRDRETIKYDLAKLMETKPAQINIKSLIKGDDKRDRITFALSGTNLTLNRVTYNWDVLNEKIIKERENLLLISALLYFRANNSKYIKVDDEKYSIDVNSIAIKSLEPLCAEGQSLTKYGFICGKFSNIIFNPFRLLFLLYKKQFADMQCKPFEWSLCNGSPESKWIKQFYPYFKSS